ncbi:MAG: hypothetical protein EOO01_06260 [Chitinophagaceae bacterium]|nr:MAG: hypothetical protein EOO01_06260 [Chitinophagaceae bacterium]
MRPILVLLVMSVLALTILVIVVDQKSRCHSGGYSYSSRIEAKDSNHFAYPLRNKLEGHAGFFYTYIGTYWRNGYDEPNISLRPLPRPIFRLIFEASYQRNMVIAFGEGEMIVKRQLKGSISPDFDSTKLTSEERVHFLALSRYANFGYFAKEHYRKTLVDSLARVNPKWLEPAYLDSLIRKVITPSPEKLTYSTTRIPLSTSQYSELICAIDASNYWTLPFEQPCLMEVSAGHIYTLEANTQCRYNIVQRSSCGHEDKAFTVACQRIIDFAGLGKEIVL